MSPSRRRVSRSPRCGFRTTRCRPTGSASRTRRRTLAYSGDSGPSEKLTDLAEEVDLFLCEATLKDGESDGQPRGHLSADEAVSAFEASGAKRLVLTHRPQELGNVDGLEQAKDGLELDV